MVNTVVINYQHVERMKLTNETTVYVQFASGTTRIFEFIEPTLPAKMIVAFENWLDQRHQYGGYVVKIGQDGKASGKQCLKRQDDKWIPVSERLPEKYTPVWVTTTWGEQHSGNLTDDCWTGLFRDFREGEITHWMPLPPNPESPNDTQTQTIVYGKESD